MAQPNVSGAVDVAMWRRVASAGIAGPTNKGKSNMTLAPSATATAEATAMTAFRRRDMAATLLGGPSRVAGRNRHVYRVRLILCAPYRSA